MKGENMSWNSVSIRINRPQPWDTLFKEIQKGKPDAATRTFRFKAKNQYALDQIFFLFGAYPGTPASISPFEDSSITIFVKKETGKAPIKCEVPFFNVPCFFEAYDKDVNNRKEAEHD